MKQKLPISVCLFMLGTLAPVSSAKPVPLEPPDPGRGIIGVRIKVIPPAKMGGNFCDSVYFVRVVEDADRFGAENFIPSDFLQGRNVYLRHAKPGRYVAVGRKYTIQGSGADGTVVFSKADISKTEVEVAAGAVVFMGEMEAQSSTKTGESDEAESQYLRIVAPTAAAFWTEAIEKGFKKEPAWVSHIMSRPPL